MYQVSLDRVTLPSSELFTAIAHTNPLVPNPPTSIWDLHPCFNQQSRIYISSKSVSLTKSSRRGEWYSTRRIRSWRKIFHAIIRWLTTKERSLSPLFLFFFFSFFFTRVWRLEFSNTVSLGFLARGSRVCWHVPFKGINFAAGRHGESGRKRHIGGSWLDIRGTCDPSRSLGSTS